MYRMRKTVRYMFQITPFDNERRRNRVELIDAVEDRLGEEHLLLNRRCTTFRKLTEPERQLVQATMSHTPIDYECCTFEQATHFLESVFSKDDLLEFLCVQLEQKKTLISINICEGLALEPQHRDRSKSVASTTETGQLEEEFVLEHCELESVPYEIMFADVL